MFAEERYDKIMELIKLGQPVKVTELSMLFSISEATIRRDLQELESLGFLQRTHGGAIAPRPISELSFHDREICFLDEKRQIALTAASLVKDGETILLDAGTTTREIARALCGKRLTVATNSMDVAFVFSEEPDIEVLLLGGTWRKSIHSLVGPLTNSILKLLCFDKVFLAANAVDCTLGATTPTLLEAETKQAMINAAKTVVLVADHSKLEKRAFAKICNLNEISMIITDSGITKDTLDCLREHTQVLVSETPLKKQELDTME